MVDSGHLRRDLTLGTMFSQISVMSSGFEMKVTPGLSHEANASLFIRM
jgi:hypothetical protein